MLNVQKLLLELDSSFEMSLEVLKDKYAITSNVHEDGRVILNYDQIKSPKTDKIVRECRGLVLDKKWNLVAKSFNRFFNAGEHREDDKKFNWDNKVVSLDKEDGSLIIVYHYNGEWRVNTRNSFGEGEINDSGKKWKELVLSVLDLSKLNDEFTYTFELCSIYNKIVRRYSKTELFLLTCFYGETELTFDAVKSESRDIGISTPEYYEFTDIFQVNSHIAKVAENDATYEGIVCRDCFNNRIKLKSPHYLMLHRLSNNGNVASVKNIVPLVMAGEKDELLTYFPELTESVLDVESKIEKAWKEVDNAWYCYNDIDNQKKFALEIQKATKYTAPLFSAKKTGKNPSEFWTPEFVLKNVFNKE